MAKFKVGDKIRCINQGVNCYIDEGSIYEVLDCDDKFVTVKTSEGGWSYDLHRFEAVEEKVVEEVVPSEKPILTMQCGGITVTFDPNAPFSRKFAEVFLKVVYEGTY